MAGLPARNEEVSFDDPYRQPSRIAIHLIGPDLEDPTSQLSGAELARVAQFSKMVDVAARKTHKDWKVEPDEHEEVLADGFLGLVQAAKDFDKAKVSEDAITSSDYFYKTIVGNMLKGMRKRYGRENYVIKDENGEIVGKVDRISKLKPSVVHKSAESLEAPEASAARSNGGDLPLGETIAKADSELRMFDELFAKQALEKMMAGRSERDRTIIYRYFVLGETQAEVGVNVGLQQMQISRIIKRARAELAGFATD